MSNPHSTVTYVEPNLNIGLSRQTSADTQNGYSTDNWHPADGFERAPRLEDYCIALNLEVEVSSRDSKGTSDVIILQWGSGDKEHVSFMGGTKIGGCEVSGTKKTPRLSSRDYLTTYYADMYVGDLVDYGTTEMIGIKSVNIEYAKSCVPMITIKFTDVRGLSLMQPTELSRNNNYDGIRGLSKDNIAQSFFQCFFKMPLPKFTIYIKGYYGKPVAYEMMCDKFETNFNSDTGDYDVDTHFIGYSYSFMTDISFDALLAAPYSDYKGEAYWKSQVDKERFFLWDKLHTKKMPMPTLYEVYTDFNSLKDKTANEMLDTTLTAEELNHTDEIKKLQEIQGKYQQWYQSLFNLLKENYGKRYCFDFRDNQNESSDWFRILILTNSNTVGVDNLKNAYENFTDSFKKINDNLYALIDEFNNSGNSYKKLKNISKDFSKYTRIKLFNDCYVNHNTRKVEFGGFNRECKLNKTQVINRLFYGEQSDLDKIPNGATEDYINQVKNYKSSLKDFTLSTIYSDGSNQYKDAYIIEVDYSDISRRIKILQVDAAKDDSKKEAAKRRKEHNRLMMSKMNWYPSVENFMKIMMAHVETYMHMMYELKNSCKGRTANELGITFDNLTDVNINSKEIPPFPRVAKKEMDEYGTKEVDAWVGEFNKGSKRFEEEDLIDGLFNAVDKLKPQSELDKEKAEDGEGLITDVNPIIKHPLTSYDFYVTKNPYGDDTDISNNPNAFAAKVAMRMFMILSINNFKKEYEDKWSFSNGKFLESLGQIEAENFHDCVSISNDTMLKMLGTEGGEGTITPQSIIECVKGNKGIGGNKDLPWNTDKNNKDRLFDDEFWLSFYTTTTSKIRLYPIQNMSFSALTNSMGIVNKGENGMYSQEDIMLSSLSMTNSKAWEMLNSKNQSGFGNLYIVDDYKVISNILESSCSSPSNSYKDVYDLIHDASTFNKGEYKEMLYKDGVFRPRRNILSLTATAHNTIGKDAKALYTYCNPNTRELLQSGSNKEEYSFDITKLDDYANECENNSITSWFFTECRGFDIENGVYKLSKNKSLFTQGDFMGLVPTWTFESVKYENDKWCGLFLMGLDSIDYNNVAKQLNTDRTFTYLPKLAVLQIGAALMTLPNIKARVTKEMLEENIPLPETFKAIIPYLNKISHLTRVAYIRYFKNWSHDNYASTKECLYNSKSGITLNVAVEYNVDGGTFKRHLFREDSNATNVIANELMLPVVVGKGNVNHYEKVGKEKLVFSEKVAESFLGGFLSRLRALYGVSDTSGGNAVKLAAEPTKTTEDMKKELYRYMKLVYEKWIPSMEFKEWEFETFFDTEKEKGIRSNGSNGHMFHFIDSFYNKIGEKLLINPKALNDLIDNALNAKNTNAMMLGFIADVLSKNKAMLLCLQNFQDLAEKEAMEMMFRPIPFNAIRDVNKHPDFVVLYPYEPSKYLNTDNSEFTNDSFMLNDEFETPLAIRSRVSDPNKNYQIPAFGVSYGKQYQSYFKKVNVGMQSPIATQQSILAKHAILRQSQDGRTQTTVAQDMYDIYATQSYTCTVEMMGCAWVQPLMYFVLTNIPLFKGSYLIFKVTHSITPGNMVTKFMGTRMAKVTNRLVDEIFTDDEEAEVSNIQNDDRRHALANVDNDCPYKVYPLFESDVEVSKDEMENANNAMRMLMTSGFTKEAAAGICGNIYVESNHWNLYAIGDNGKAFGLCQWRGTRRKLLEKRSNSTRPSFEQQIDFIRFEWFTKPSEGGDSAYNYRKELLAAKTPDGAAEIVCNRYERPSVPHMSERKERAKKYYNLYKEGGILTRVKDAIKPNNKNIYDGFLNAVQKSLDSVNAKIKIDYSNDTKNNNAVKSIVRTDGGTEKMDLVFDIILNGYYDYVQRVDWIMPDSDNDAPLSNPKEITVKISEKVEPQSRKVYVKRKKGSTDNTYGPDDSTVNKSLLKSLYKRYKGDASEGNKKELQQFNFDIFKNIASEIKDCDTLMGNGNSNLQSPSGVISANPKIKIDGWDVGKSIAWIETHASTCNSEYCGKGACASYVEDAIGCKDSGLRRMDTSEVYHKSPGSKFATNLWYDGILANADGNGNGFKMIHIGKCTPNDRETNIKLQAGDVAIIGRDAKYDGGKYHACIWSGNQWISDYKQGKKMSPYGKKEQYLDGYLPYAIFRYHNKQGVSYG